MFLAAQAQVAERGHAAEGAESVAAYLHLPETPTTAAEVRARWGKAASVSEEPPSSTSISGL